MVLGFCGHSKLGGGLFRVSGIKAVEVCQRKAGGADHWHYLEDGKIDAAVEQSSIREVVLGFVRVSPPYNGSTDVS